MRWWVVVGWAVWGGVWLGVVVGVWCDLIAFLGKWWGGFVACGAFPEAEGCGVRVVAVRW